MRCGTKQGLDAHKSRNEYPCKFCIRFRDNPTPTPKKVAPEPVNRCGTPRGRRDHVGKDEPICDPCRIAHNNQERERYKASRNSDPTDIKHGTVWGYKQHKDQNVPRCQPCKDANNAEQRARYKPSTRVLVECGTHQGRRKHLRNKTPICDACMQAPQPPWKQPKKVIA